MDFLPAAFAGLNSFKQFIIYSLSPNGSKLDKFPLDYRTGIKANPHDPAIWTDAITAIAAAKAKGAGHGVGFVFTADDPFFFLDIDKCYENNKWSDLSIKLLEMFSGAAVEVSSSGKGLHVIGKGSAPEHLCKNEKLGIELYTEKRFVALTGFHASGSVEGDFTPQLAHLVTEYFTGVIAEVDNDWWSYEPCAEWKGSIDDDELIDRALRSQSAASVFGTKATFRDLFEANEDSLVKAFPPNDKDIYNRSSADAALAQHLAFWTGNHAERMQGIMLRSKLGREKWERPDYLPRTIRVACAKQKQWCQDKQPEPLHQDRVDPTIVNGTTFLTLDQQQELFKGCVWVRDENKILIPGGSLLNNERFKVEYGGYSFPTDAGNGRVTRNAWEAFTESQAIRFPRAHGTCFRPDLPAGEIITTNAKRLVNIFSPVNSPRKKGDVTIFLRHVEKLFPDPRDQIIFLSYLAAAVQYQGVKFTWCPMIQGVEGNGKTFFTNCMAFIFGDDYFYSPRAEEISNKFNSWMFGKIFISIEDIYFPASKVDIFETLKPLLTGQKQEVEFKGHDKVMKTVCANFLINSNHKDGIRKTANDRRIAPFYTAQQCKDDLRRDGMDGRYFTKLFDWSERQEGFAMIHEFLWNYDIPEHFNPAGLCRYAPETTATMEAIEYSREGAAQEVIEAIEQGQIGFRGGWVSSVFLDRLIKEMRVSLRIPQNKRRDFMKDLGYVWHPALKNGRVNNSVIPDNSKPRLYIRHDHADLHLISASEIAKKYADAQKED